jgi:hypothetical protein
MQPDTREFVEALVEDSPRLQAVYREFLDEWAIDDQPEIVLFGALGRQIASDFDRVEKETNERRFALIESGVDDEGELGTAIATGLIESLVSNAELQEGLWPRILPSFGKRSREYIEAWFALQESIAQDLATS